MSLSHKSRILIFSVFWNREKKHLPDQSLHTRCQDCLYFLQQWYHIWNSSCNRSHPVIKFMVIHCHSPRPICFLTGQTESKGGVWENHHPCIFKGLDDIINLPKWYSIAFGLSLGKEGFPFDFSHHQIPSSANPKANTLILPNGWGYLFQLYN